MTTLKQSLARTAVGRYLPFYNSRGTEEGAERRAVLLFCEPRADRTVPQGLCVASGRNGRRRGEVCHCQSVETGTAKSLSPNGTTVSWSYSTKPMMKRLPQASASLRMPEKSAPVTVAAALASIPTT